MINSKDCPELYQAKLNRLLKTADLIAQKHRQQALPPVAHQPQPTHAPVRTRPRLKLVE